MFVYSDGTYIFLYMTPLVLNHLFQDVITIITKHVQYFSRSITNLARAIIAIIVIDFISCILLAPLNWQLIATH